jgi:Uma2 family endonuclease
MTQALPKVVTFEEFVSRLPENSGVRYELHNGNIIEMAQPVGEHEEVKGFLIIKQIKPSLLYSKPSYS